MTQSPDQQPPDQQPEQPTNPSAGPTYGGPVPGSPGPGVGPGPGAPAPGGPTGPRPTRPTAQFRPQQPAKRGMNGCLVAMLVALVLGGGAALLGLFVVVAATSGGAGGAGGVGPNEIVVERGDGPDKIVIIPVNGVIQSGAGGSSEMLISYIRKAGEDPKVKAVILDMNTPGGEVTATDEVYHELQKLRKGTDERPGIYTVTCMRSIAASGGYYLAAGTDHIVANRLTFTGSIGVVIAGYNYNGLLEKIGVEHEVFATGDNKDILSMSRPRREDEAAIINQLVDETYNEFATIVVNGRSKAGVTREKFDATPEIHDSRVLSGTQALELGLVDQLGYMEDAIAHARTSAGIDNATVVEYMAPPSLRSLLLGVEADEKQTPKSLQDFVTGANPEMRKGCMYFISPLSY